MKLLITGICGFVGSTLAQRLIEEIPGIEILGIDNFSRSGGWLNKSKLQTLGVKFFYGDIRNESDFSSIPRVDWVIDAAANPSVMAGVDKQSSSRQVIENNV